MSLPFPLHGSLARVLVRLLTGAGTYAALRLAFHGAGLDPQQADRAVATLVRAGFVRIVGGTMLSLTEKGVGAAQVLMLATIKDVAIRDASIPVSPETPTNGGPLHG